MWADAVKLESILGQSIGIQSLMSYGIDIDFLAGSLPEPVIRAEPGSVVARGSQVTIICEGTPGAQNYYLYQLGNQSSLQRLTLMKPGNTAKFLIPIIQWFHAGRYLCFYYEPPRRSKKSNILELVVTGKGSCLSFHIQERVCLFSRGFSSHNSTMRDNVGYMDPCYVLLSRVLTPHQLSALTSLVVTSGENMTFQCASWERYNGFRYQGRLEVLQAPGLTVYKLY